MSLSQMIGSVESEGLVQLGDEQHYVMLGTEAMPPFLMSVVSDGDRWMFVSSDGGLTAGRRDAAHALFPYETDDRLHETSGVSGPVTVVRLAGEDDSWRPFRPRETAQVNRRIAKSVTGDTVIVEEDHPEGSLTASYVWNTSEDFGFIRTSTIANNSAVPLRVAVLDGVLNVNPYGIDIGMQHAMRNLSNAYKRSEIVDGERGLALFSLEAQIADRPEPTEVLRATTVWHSGPRDFEVTLDRNAVRDAERGGAVTTAALVTGQPGAYLVHGEITLEPGASQSWTIVCDVARDHGDVAELLATIGSASNLDEMLAVSVQRGRERLSKMMASADSGAASGDDVACANHIANVTYNVMRGGIPLDGYRIDTKDFQRFVAIRNATVATEHAMFLASLPDWVTLGELTAKVSAEGSSHLVRLGFEYLPFGFSRRHGDPSRPWNNFSIQVRDENGEPTRHYEGNWRDIFQNWEALCASYPDYLTSVISVFVNASTVDGFNPYRISRSGIDWEVPEPENPWSNIGYWGDHQIDYLLALLEASERFNPGEIRRLLNERRYSFADVPYRIAPYEQIVANPKATITFDEVAHDRALLRADAVGGDGRLLWNDGEIHLATLAEKLFVPALSKVCNLVPGGGIWMNTQRPEWNDANNALVGHGLSMVTLFHLRRYLAHLETLCCSGNAMQFSVEVSDWLAATTDVLRRHSPVGAESADDDAGRRRLMDELGEVFSSYRQRVYDGGFSAQCTVESDDLQRFCVAALAHLDASIERSRRPDGLFHSYNLLQLDDEHKTASVQHLDVMLEGQVAALGSGTLGAREAAEVVEALFESPLYRPDAKSFVLYPATPPRAFLSKNVIPDIDAAAISLLREGESSAASQIVTRDRDGVLRFRADLYDRASLRRVLDELSTQEDLRPLVDACAGDVLALYERVFGHHSYTGRSSSMYAYEGIGSIYWHMVAKLLVAIQGVIVTRGDGDSNDADVQRLVDLYWRVRQGSGRSKTVLEWGALPTDPYSHSPAHAGAQQPGMTGLAKEEVLARRYELGANVREGRICFDPTLLRESEFTVGARRWEYLGVDEAYQTIDVPARAVGFTICQVPVVIRSGSDTPLVQVHRDGDVVSYEGLSLDADLSREIFQRSGVVSMVSVSLPR